MAVRLLNKKRLLRRFAPHNDKKELLAMTQEMSLRGLRGEAEAGRSNLNQRGQGTLELSLVFITMVLFLGGVLNIWLWVNRQLVRRQVEYNETRVRAGTSSDGYTLEWPVHQPEALGEDKVLLTN